MALPRLDLAGSLVASAVSGVLTYRALPSMPQIAFDWQVRHINDSPAAPSEVVWVAGDPASPAPTLAFMPKFFPFTALGAQEATYYRVSCTVTVKHAGTETVVTVGPVTVPVPVVPVPTVMLMGTAIFPWMGSEKNASLLVAVPAASGLTGVEDVGKVLHELVWLLRRVAAVNQAYTAHATGLATALDLLMKFLAFRVAVSLDRRDQVSRMNDIVIDPGMFWFMARNFADAASCLLLIGPPGQRVRACDYWDLDPSGGYFEITLDSRMYCFISNLGFMSVHEPANLGVEKSRENMNDQIASYRFFPPA